MALQSLLIDRQQTPNLDHIKWIMQWLHTHGHAVIVWTPEELRGCDPGHMEDRSTEFGWDVIDMAVGDGAGTIHARNTRIIHDLLKED